MADPSAPPASSPPRGVWRRRGRWVLLALGLTLAGVAVAWKPATKLWQRGEQRYVRWRVDRFLNQAGEAVRSERPQVARAALEAAAALSPGDWTIRLALTDVLLTLGSVAEADALWRRWMDELDPNDRRRLPVVYAGKLLAAGQFDFLGRLGCRQLVEAGPDFGVWLNVTAEAGALAGGPALESYLAEIPDLVVCDVVTAYWRARARRFEEAIALLAKVDRPLMRPAVALLSARTWVLAGDRPRARLALAQAARAIDSLEALAQQPLTEELDGSSARRIVRTLLSPRWKEEVQMKSLLTFALHGLGDPQREAAEEMLEILRPRVSRLESSQMAALWLYSGLAGATDAERFWRELIGQQTGLTVPPLRRGEITVPMARLVLLRTSLPLEFSLRAFSITELISPSAPNLYFKP